MPEALRRPHYAGLAVFLALAGCASTVHYETPPTTVEPLTEVEFERFADDTADLLVALLERGRWPLPLVIPPGGTIDAGDVPPGVARAFQQRLEEALCDRLAGNVRFGVSVNGPRLSCMLTFVSVDDGGPRRRVEFGLLEADSGAEVLRSVGVYTALPAYSRLREQVKSRRAAQNAPASQPVVRHEASTQPAPHVASAAPAPSGTAVKGQQVTRGAAVESPAPQHPAPSKARQPMPANSAAAGSRMVRIDESGATLASKARELAATRPELGETLARGQAVFLTPEARESLLISSVSVRPLGKQLSLELVVAAREGTTEGKLRVLFLDKSGGLLEAGEVTQSWFASGYGRTITAQSRRPGAARFMVVLSKD